MRIRSRILLFAGLLFLPFSGKGLERISGNEVFPAQTSSKPRVLQVNLRSEINGYSWLIIQKSIAEAAVNKYNCVLIVLNTYGGEVLYADSIRTKILNAKIPVYVFIDNNAASAGALISIACDKIFMRTSGAIGASTVVDQSGATAPDKYQSYMRGIIRATAESHGKDTIVSGGITQVVWHRDPKIAEAMVDPNIYVEGINEKGKVLTFTANEALQNGYCDGIAESPNEVLTKHIGYSDYDLTVFKMSGVDRLKGHLMGTALRGFLIMIIVAGIWFELQAPGIGFPTLAAVVAAVLYFLPLYIDGLAQNWEIIIFVIGLVFLFLEIFIIPGFGLVGILGILFIICGLTFALIDSSVFEFSLQGLNGISEPLLLVSVSIILAVSICLWITTKIGRGKSPFQKLALTAAQNKEEGYVSVPMEAKELVGKTGIADTVLRLSGKVRVNDKIYDAVSEYGFIEKGETVIITRYESGQVYVTNVIDKGTATE